MNGSILRSPRARALMVGAALALAGIIVGATIIATNGATADPGTSVPGFSVFDRQGEAADRVPAGLLDSTLVADAAATRRGAVVPGATVYAAPGTQGRVCLVTVLESGPVGTSCGTPKDGAFAARTVGPDGKAIVALLVNDQTTQIATNGGDKSARSNVIAFVDDGSEAVTLQGNRPAKQLPIGSLRGK